MARPQPVEYPSYFESYLELVQGNSITEIFSHHQESILAFIQSIPAEKASFVYAPGKWTVKQVLQHIIDAERVFVYRAMRFSRKDITPLEAFDENNYAINDATENRTLYSLQSELTFLQQSTDIFLANLTDEQLACTGTASGKKVTVNALAYFIYGHKLHHLKVLERWYGIKFSW